jgi:hypothetical protein
MRFPLACILFLFFIVSQQFLALPVSPAQQIEAIVNPYLKTVEKEDDRILFLQNLQIFLFNGYSIIGKTDSDARSSGEIQVSDEDLLPIDDSEEQTLIKQLQYVVWGLQSPEKSPFMDYFRVTVGRRDKFLHSTRRGSQAYTSKIQQMMGDLRRPLDVAKMPLDPNFSPPIRIESIVNRYLKTMDEPDSRQSFIAKLRIFFLNEYDITGETTGSHKRTNGEVTVRIAKGVGAPADKEGVLVDHLEYVVEGLMSNNPTYVSVWKKYFNGQVKQRKELLSVTRPGSKHLLIKLK